MKKIFKFILNTIPRPILIRLSIVVRPILAFLLKGSRFTDPIDGKSFRMFLPYGYGNQRNNVLSPSTLSLERHRLLWLYLQNETDFFQSELDSDSPVTQNKRIKLRKDGNFIMYACETEKFYYVICFATS